MFSFPTVTSRTTHVFATRKTSLIRRPAKAKLMYTPHPDRNAIGAALPEDLVEAVRHRHEISYSVLREMREIVWALAELIVSVRPHLLPFFATGGIPYVFPVMHVLSDRREREFTDGSRFHMFPGLAWGGKLDGQTTLAFFVREFGKQVNASLAANGRTTVVQIDTTNTGNSTSRFVRSMHELCVQHSIQRPDDLTVRVVAIVNRKRAADGTHEEGTSPVQTSAGNVPVLIPEGFRATGPLIDRQPTVFVREDGHDRFHLTVSYWITEDIPTEDKADLLGVHANHDLLGVRSGVTPGRLVIRFPDGRSSEDTGENTPGHRLINMLSKPLTSEAWRVYEQYANSLPLTPEQAQFVEEAKVWSEAPLRLTELDSGDPERSAQALLAINRLLTGVEIHWLSTAEGIPERLLPKLEAKVLATLRRDPAADPDVKTIRIDQTLPRTRETVEPEATVAPEAVKFLRRFRPEIAAEEQEGDWPVKARWWLERLKKQ